MAREKVVEIQKKADRAVEIDKEINNIEEKLKQLKATDKIALDYNGALAGMGGWTITPQTHGELLKDIVDFIEVKLKERVEQLDKELEEM